MFDTLIQDAQSFVRALSRHNTRDWFLAHKDQYDATLRDPALALLEDVAPRLEQLCGYRVTPKLFRPQRDVRFSKDKTPYKTHLHMMWTIHTGARQDPAFFFGIDPDRVTIATGMMAFDRDVLGDWRKMVDLDGPRIATLLGKAADLGYLPWEPTLKRVPPPYDKDHPQGQLLRHKGLVVAGNPDLSGDLPRTVEQALAHIWPVSDMLIGVAETPTL